MTDDVRIAFRMGTEDFQEMDDFMVEHDLENKSIFIRDAIKAYIANYDAQAPQASEGGIFVRLSDLHMDALNQLVQRGICLDEEEFIRRCVLEKIVPKTIEEEAYADSFRTAQRNAALK